jgi:hypothetical protein
VPAGPLFSVWWPRRAAPGTSPTRPARSRSVGTVERAVDLNLPTDVQLAAATAIATADVWAGEG